MGGQPDVNQLNLIVADMEATLAFYRALGLEIEPSPGGKHAEAKLPGGLSLEWDTASSAGTWDSGWEGGGGGSVVIGFAVGDRAEVDELFATLTAAGHRGHQQPYDAFWGARYAIVDDPDGRAVGIMSPSDPDRRYWPPGRPPSDAA